MTRKGQGLAHPAGSSGGPSGRGGTLVGSSCRPITLAFFRLGPSGLATLSRSRGRRVVQTTLIKRGKWRGVRGVAAFFEHGMRAGGPGGRLLNSGSQARRRRSPTTHRHVVPWCEGKR